MTRRDPPPAAHPVLQPMTATHFERFVRNSTVGYADDKVRAGQWPVATALEQSQAEFNRLLPQGLATPGQHLFDIVDQATGEVVGNLWFAAEGTPEAPTAYVYDLTVLPQHQRKGHARRAFMALEDKARALGLPRIDLHVFGHNPGAQALYAALGYQVTSVTMAKDLGPATP
jgi:ribosomal protein S18 acetylase RimI-like enzyme